MTSYHVMMLQRSSNLFYFSSTMNYQHLFVSEITKLCLNLLVMPRIL